MVLRGNLRYGLAAVVFVIAFGLVAMVAALPWTAPDKPGLAFVLCLIVGFVLVGRMAWRPRPWAFWLIPLAAVLLIPAVALSRSFRRIDMLAIVFHKDFGMQGATLAGLGTQILQGVLCGVGLVMVFVGLSSLGRWRNWHFGMAALAIMAINPVMQFLAVSQLRAAVPSDLAQQLVQPVLRPATLQHADPDILMIYMESLDRQFADPAVWGEVYAPLNAFAAQGTTFTRVGQIAGTGWSLAGIVSSNCAVPIVARGPLYRTAFEDIDTFMPAMTCFGDVIAARGYDAAYVVGGDLGFGGLGVFFRTHQIPDVTGKIELEAIYSPQEVAASLIGWVMDDQMVFDYSRQKLAALQGQPEPFALIVETIGPHADNGFLSRHCTDDGQAGFSRDMQRVLDCTIKDMLAFIAHAQAEQLHLRPGRDLAIILLSDHLSAHPRPPPVAPEYDGFNTVIMVGAGLESGRIVTKPGSMIDVMPTMLDWFDWAEDPVAAGLGRSLLGTGKTIVEQHGIDALDSMIATDVALANRVWAEGTPAP
jgi:phosphoglycerol transferase